MLQTNRDRRRGAPALLALVLACALALTGCGQVGGGEAEPEGEESLQLVASTYPVYLFARAVTQGVEGVSVSRLNTGSVSCLHDYTLSMSDMKLIEGADVLALSGVGLEDFMDDALAAATGTVIDCSAGVELLENEDHDHQEGDDGHDHGHYDPHYWMDPANAGQMIVNLQNAMLQLDPDHEGSYRANGQAAAVLLNSWETALQEILDEARGQGEEIAGLITFHDGFRYFARAFDLPLLASIEEEEGSEASAREILEITELVKQYHLPVIFTEVNGSDATAQAIARETGCAVAQLTMLMDGPEDGALSAYYDGLQGNLTAILTGFSGEGAA